MSRTNDPKNFFQTTSALEESARKSAKSTNKTGNPIKLPSKILAVAADPRDEKVLYVAEAAGNVKSILLEVGEVRTTFIGPRAPLTSLTLSPQADKIYAGCWDKSIWSWELNEGHKVTRTFQGHTDFVKAVISIQVQGKEILVSGSADATIIVWDAETGEKLHLLKGHTRGILALAIDPLEYDPAQKEVSIFSAGSDREIRRWKIGIASAAEIQGTKDIPAPIIVHETSIDSLRFDADGDLWTASADKSSKCLSRSQNWAVDTSLTHPDFVRDVAIDEIGGWVITACRDEHVRVWEKGSGKTYHVFEGHFEEVTGLVFLARTQNLVSVSIDGTVRQWSLKRDELEKAIQEAKDEQEGKTKEPEKAEPSSLMTAEEEAELAELMGDSDEE